MLEWEGSAETLRRLSRSNLLLVPLDRRDEQYRYHALLHQMLQSELHRLGAPRESELHARASRWHAEQGDFDRAIPHAISAGDIQQAGELIWANTAYYESHGREATVRRWLDRFTDAQIAASPTLCLALATNHLSRGEGDEVEHWTGVATRSLEKAPRSEWGALRVGAALIRASGAARDGVARMGEDAVHAYELLPEDSPWRPLCRLVEGAAHHLMGNREQARAALEEGSRLGGVTTPSVQTLCLAQIALLELDEDDVDAASALAVQATAEADRYGLNDYPTSTLVFAVSALVRARRGRIEDATRDVKRSTGLLDAADEPQPVVRGRDPDRARACPLAAGRRAAARTHLLDAARYLRQTSDATVLAEWLEEASKEADSAASAHGQWPLTMAELRLLHCLPTHLSFREIAEQLFVSTNTVKTQARSIYRKLGVSSRAEAVATAGAAGLIETGQAASPHGPTEHRQG